MAGSDGARDFVERLRTELPRLLRDDVEVRGQIIALLSDYLTTRQETATILAEIREMREDFDRRMDEHARRMDEHARRMDEQGHRIEEQGRRIEEQGHRIEENTRALTEHTRILAEHGRALGQLERTLSGVGARWGILNEEAFRQSVAVLFSDQPEVRVEHWRHHDAEGAVFGYPADVDMDVVVRDGTLTLVEIKSAISAADVVLFLRRVDLYHKVTGRKPDRLLMIGPYIEGRAYETGKRAGVELVSGVTPPRV